MENLDKEMKELNELLNKNLNYELHKKEKDLFGEKRNNLIKDIDNLYGEQIRFGQSLIIGYILSTIENSNCSIEILKESLLNFIESNNDLSKYVMEIKYLYDKEIYDCFKKE